VAATGVLLWRGGVPIFLCVGESGELLVSMVNMGVA